METLKIGNVTLDNPLVLAPMAGVTDLPFRLLCKEHGVGLVCMEMVSAKAIYYKNKNTEQLLEIYPQERPVSLQLFGSDADIIAEMAAKIEDRPFDILDFNMGCPVPNVAERGKGSGLILRPEVAAELIEAAKAGGLPVSVKTRLGFTDTAEMEEWISHLLKQDIANLSVHMRTRKEMSKVAAHWELIPRIVELRDEIAPQTLITINGDILDRQMGLELAEKIWCGRLDDRAWDF